MITRQGRTEAEGEGTLAAWTAGLNGNCSLVARAALHLATTLDVDQSLSIAVEHVGELLGGAPFAIVLSAADAPRLVVGGQRWSPRLRAAAEEFLQRTLRDNPLGAAPPVVINWSAARALEGDEEERPSPKAFDSIPLVGEGRTLGAIGLAVPLGSLTPGTAGRLRALAVPVALALRNALEHEALRGLAFRDFLTGLYNRRAFDEMLDAQFSGARRYSRPLSILALDVDNLKEINDRFGHEAGDAVIREMGKILQRLVRKSDLPARTGGDEFAVILPDTGRESAEILARRLAEGLKCEVVLPGRGALEAGVSVGVGSVEGDGAVAAEALLRAADQALYAAKRKRRDEGRHACTAAAGDDGERHGL